MNKKFLNNTLKQDFYQYGSEFYPRKLISYIFGKSISFKFICLFRLTQACQTKAERKIVRQLLMRVERKYGLEIPDTISAGPGLYIGHPYGITVNPEVVLGKCVSLHKGVTLGKENRGKRKGAPVISDRVWFGINSTVVGNVKIGNDVLIAPNSFVNVDVPDHSIVMGNPCVIISSENATLNHIKDREDE